MLGIDLSGKRAFIAGVADDGGYGFAIAKALAEAGASICVGTWPPAYTIFTTMLERGKFDQSMTLASGEKMSFEGIYALDASFDVADDVPQELKEHKRYKDHQDVSIDGVATRLRHDFGSEGIDIVVHSLANGPEVKNPLIETSRAGYLAAIGTSAYSLTSIVRSFGPLMPQSGAFLALTYMASERVIPEYGGGMSSAKAALESDCRLLAYESGRKWGHRVNIISAGPYASRAASAIGFIDKMIDYTSKNSPLKGRLEGQDVGQAGAFLCSPMAKAITGTVLYVDHGYHSMGMAVE